MGFVLEASLLWAISHIGGAYIYPQGVVNWAEKLLGEMDEFEKEIGYE